jgi:hypothetical protein
MKQLLVVASLLALAGPRAAAAQPGACVPGAQVECACVGGVKSVQVCAPDGASFLPCQCAGPAAGPPSPAGPPPGAGPTVAPTPAPAPGATGSIDVSADAPAVISVDGGEVGRAPVHVGDLKPGVHVVGSRFDAGGETRKKVRVGAGETTAVAMEIPASAQAAVWRRGARLAFAAGAEVFGHKKWGAGVSPEVAVNYGISPAFDLRVGGRLMLADREGFLFLAGVPVSARFNLGSTFAMGVGAFVGVRSAATGDDDSSFSGTGQPPPETATRETGISAGPEAYPAIFRLGAKREFELGLMFGYLFHVTAPEDTGAHDVLHCGINVTYLLL